VPPAPQPAAESSLPGPIPARFAATRPA